jgi:hypothetical protein
MRAGFIEGDVFVLQDFSPGGLLDNSGFIGV